MTKAVTSKSRPTLDLVACLSHLPFDGVRGIALKEGGAWGGGGGGAEGLIKLLPQ